MKIKPSLFLIMLLGATILNFFVSCDSNEVVQTIKSEFNEKVTDNHNEKDTTKIDPPDLNDNEENTISKIFTNIEPDPQIEQDIPKSISNEEINNIKGKYYYYGVIVKDFNNDMNIEDGYAESIIEPMYEIDYNKSYNSIKNIPVDLPYCKITYNTFSKAIKKEMFDENKNILYTILSNYNKTTHLLLNEKKYNSSNYIILEKEYYENSKRLKEEKLYDDYGQLINCTSYKYNNDGKIREEIIKNEFETIEIRKYEYIDNNKNKKTVFSDNGSIKTELILNQYNKPIKVNYYDENKIIYSEEIEYYNDGYNVYKKKDIDINNGSIQIITFDKEGYQIEIVSMENENENENNDNIEKKVFFYDIVNENKVVDLIEIYINNSESPIESISYFYDKDGEINNWFKYDSKGNLISSMDNQTDRE